MAKKAVKIRRPMPEDPTDRYIRETCAELEGKIDREALQLLCRVGIFAVGDPSALNDAVSRLWASDAWEDKFRAAEARVKNADTETARREAERTVESLRMEEVTESVDAAYLLGIAVGRRVGPSALLPRGVQVGLHVRPAAGARASRRDAATATGGLTDVTT